MVAAEDANPYASPAAPGESLSKAEREVRVVIRVFRYIGWFGLVFWSFMAFVCAAGFAALLLAQTETRGPSLVWLCLFGVAVYSTFAVVSFAYVRTAAKMAHCRADARKNALALSGLLLIGFPLFTVVGVFCIRKIRRYYWSYCDLYLAGDAQPLPADAHRTRQPLPPGAVPRRAS